MRLKSIKLAGFKSFVDPTTVQFPRNMSAVVGPNGCGKSNIIDAVRWVMGESSAKNLRGESMTDVIFNGSGGRQPVGQASIELVFDNSDGTLGGEYARFSEIAIRRLVTRAGQSDYFLNGTKCRRRDITDIFLGTGLGPRSYAIIEQGMISRLIESKPEELRVFIEEAAGISKYKERRRETENRMRRTLENLERLQDIRDELSRQIYHLERQAQAAEKYKEFRSREREAKAQVAAMQWRDLSIQVESLAYSINDLETQREGVIAEYRALEAQLEQTRLAYSDSTEQCNQIQAEYYSIGAEVTRFEQAIQFQQQRQGQLQQRLAQTEASLGLASESLRGDELALGHAREALDVLLPEKEEVEARAQQASDSLNDAEIAMQDWQQHWDGFNQRAAVARQQSEVQQSRIKHLEQVLSRLARRTEQLSSELASLSEIGQAEASEDYAERLEILESQRSELEAQRLSTSEQRDTLRVQLADARRELSETQTKLQQVGGRLSALESLQERDQSNSGDTLLQWIEQAGLSDLSPLVETLSVDANWRIAAERVLGDDLHGLLSKSADLSAHALDAFSAARFYLQGQTCREKREGTLASAVQSEWVPSYFNSIRTVDSIDEAQKARSSLERWRITYHARGSLVWTRLDSSFSAHGTRRQRTVSAGANRLTAY
jgi:chromosome segregation protein